MKGIIKNISLKNKSIQVENIGKENKIYTEWYEIPTNLENILELRDLKDTCVDFSYEYKNKKRYLKKFDMLKVSEYSNKKMDYNKEVITKLALYNTATTILKIRDLSSEDMDIFGITNVVKAVAKELYENLKEDWGSDKE